MSEKKTAKVKLGIEYVPTDKLIPYARNAKTHSPEQVAAIAGSIREFGFNNPVLIDPENGIIAGHGRVLAAQKLELAEIPCIRLGHLTEAQKRAYILADNKLAEYGAGWDNRMLALELDQLLADGFKPLDLGFDAGDMGKLSKDFLDLENPVGWNEDMIPVQDEERTSANNADVTDNTYCAFRHSKCIDLVTGPCLHACAYCFVRTSKAGLGQKGLKNLSDAALKKAIQEVVTNNSKMLTLGNCMDPCIKPARELLGKALRLSTENGIFTELQTKDPGAALAVIRENKIPVELVSVKASFSMLDDEGGKAAEPGAPLVSARIAAMAELSDMGVDVLFRHCPLIFGYIPQNLGEIVANSKALAYFFEPLRLAATTIAHNVPLGKSMTRHGGDLYKWLDTYMLKDDSGKIVMYGAMHYYSYDRDAIFPELDAAMQSVTERGIPFTACTGFYGLALEKYNTTGIPYGCWTANREKAGVATENNALHCRICQQRMNEVRPSMLRDLPEDEMVLELDRIQQANLPIYKEM